MSDSDGFRFGRLLSLLRWPVAIGLIAFLFYQNADQFEQLMERAVQWRFLGLAFAVCISSIILTFVRWYLLVWALDFPFTLRDALRLGAIGYLFNFVGPGGVGGDLVKAMLMAREQPGRRAVAIATILLDRILGLLALLMVGALASMFVGQGIDQREKIVAVLWGGSAVGLIGLLVMLHPATPGARWLKWLCGLPKIGPLVVDASAAISLYQTRRTIVLATVLISVVGHFGVISSFYFSARAIADVVDVPNYATHLLLIPLAEIIGVVVPTPGGIGALEGAVQESYRLAGALPGIGLLAAGAFRATTILVAAFGGLYYFSARRQIRKLMEAGDASSAEKQETTGTASE